MRKIVSSAIVLAALFPTLSTASGLGLYVPYSLGVKYDGTSTATILGNDVDADYDGTLKNGGGVGLAYDTNLGEDALYNYRIGLEFITPVDDRISDDFESSNISIIQTFGFGVFRTDLLRIWIGPRINLAYEWSDRAGVSTNGFEFGIAPAAGINVNINRALSLGFDLDYKFAAQAGASTYNNIDTVYAETRTGPTARFSVFWRFGESSSTAAKSVETQQALAPEEGI